MDDRNTHFSTESAVGRIHTDDVATDDDGGIDWSSVPTRTVDNAPYADAFGTEEFYELRTTVARPIPQPYEIDDEIFWFQKPRDSLRAAAWSADNAPFTLGHPDSGTVQTVDDIHGFWTDTDYDTDGEGLESTLLLPTDDEEAKSFVESHRDVSVGFYNQLHDAETFDGEVGAVDTKLYDDSVIDVIAYQTDILFDHIAAVETGRCSAEDGCGFAADDAHAHGAMSEVDEPSISMDDRRNDPWVQMELPEGTFYGQVVDSKRDGCFGNLFGKRSIRCAESEQNPIFLIRIYDVETEQFTNMRVARLMSETRSWRGPSQGDRPQDQGNLGALKETHGQSNRSDPESQHGAATSANGGEMSMNAKHGTESGDALSTIIQRGGQTTTKPRADAEEGAWYKWDSSGGVVYGKAVSVVTEGCTSRGKGDQEVCAEEGDPAVVLQVYDIDEDEFDTEDGERVEVRHKASELRSWDGPNTDSCGGASCGCGLHDGGDEEAEDSESSILSEFFDADDADPSEEDEIDKSGADGILTDLTVPQQMLFNEPEYDRDGETDQSLITEGDEGRTSVIQFNSDDISVHEVSFSDTADREWDEPTLNDFTEEEWEELSEDEQMAISDHYLVSKDGFPPENFGDLSLPVVDEDGTLVLNALQNAKARAGQVSGLSGDDLTRVESIIDELANENFDANFGNNDSIMSMDINVDDLSADAILSKVADEHDGVAERLNDLRGAAETADVAEDAAEELDLDSVDELADAVSMLKEQKESLEDTVEELQRPQMEEDAEFIAERTNRFGEDAEDVIDAFDADADTIAEKRELVEDLTEQYDEQTANTDNGSETAPDGTSAVDTSGGKYAKTPW